MAHIKEQIKLSDKEQLALLEFASIFAGKKDVRRYLNQVIVQRDEENTYIIATDGHKMTKITVKTELFFNANLSLESIKNANKTGLISLLQAPSEDLGQYPDINRLIPKDRTFEQETVGINACYLGDSMKGLEKLSKKLSYGNFVGVKITQLSKLQANIFEQTFNDGNIHVLILIMPMRL